MADLVIQDARHAHTADSIGSLLYRDYPEHLPCVSRIDGYAMEASAAVQRTPFDAGNTRQRRSHFVMPMKFQLAWRVNNEQLQPLFAWLNQYGYEYFSIQLSSIESSALGQFKSAINVRIMSDINISLIRVHRQNWYIVSCLAEYSPPVAYVPTPPAPVPDALELGQWYDFTYAPSMYKDYLGTLVDADGDPIYVIRERGNKPFCLRTNDPDWMDYRVGAVNGNSVGRYSGQDADNFFKSLRATVSPGSGIPDGGPLNLSHVFTNGKNQMTCVLAIRLNAESTEANVTSDHSGGYWFSTVQLVAGNTRFKISTFDTGSNKQVSIDYTNDTWAILSWRQGATQNQVRRNGGAWSSVSSTGPADLGNNYRFGSGFVFRTQVGDIAHIALIPSALSDADLLEVEQYLGASVGITI